MSRIKRLARGGLTLGMLALATSGMAAWLAEPAHGQTAYKPGPENITLPTDYQTRFVRYATIDKAERKIVRFMYVNPEAAAAAKKGEPFPDGSVLVMEDHAARLGPDNAPLVDMQGRFIPLPPILGVALQEKRAGWGVGYPDEKRNGEWEYARFNGDGTRNNAPVEACFTCHLQNVANQDFTFTTWPYFQNRR